MQRWQYLTVVTDQAKYQLVARSVNGQELRDWKKTPLDMFLIQLGTDGWEMTGTISASTVGASRGWDHVLFFKRPQP